LEGGATERRSFCFRERLAKATSSLGQQRACDADVIWNPISIAISIFRWATGSYFRAVLDVQGHSDVTQAGCWLYIAGRVKGKDVGF